MDTTVRAIVAGLGFGLIFLSGYWLSRRGRPLNTGISTLHKLISVATGVYVGVTIHQVNQADPIRAIEWVAIAIASVCTLGTVASGGALSFERPVPTALLRLHQVLPVLTALSAGVTLYLLLGGA